MSNVKQTYRFALDPTPRQQRALASHCGAARFAWNFGLGLVRRRLEERRADPTVAVPWSLAALRREWNQAKHQIAPWWADNSKEAYNAGLDALARALDAYFRSRDGDWKGPRVGFPGFKRKRAARRSCRFTTGAIRVEPDRHHVTLPRLGAIRTHESTRKLARRLEQGTARILSATVSHSGGRWQVGFICEVERAQRPARQPDAVVGVDVGIRHLAVLSTGEVIPNPQPLQTAQGRLRRLNRQLNRRQGPRAPDGSRQQPSKAWLETRTKLARTSARVANLRRDHLHKLTSGLAAAGTVVVEDLNITGMLGNRRLARRIADAGWGELRRQLGYKLAWAGGHLVVADRWYPSSKTCSACSAVKAKLPLATRTFCCQACGLELDRDLNAARNLARVVELVAGSGSGDPKRPWRGRKTRPGRADPREAGSQHQTSSGPGEAGTAEPQGPAA
jgi:IS605 OrfB family transposase